LVLAKAEAYRFVINETKHQLMASLAMVTVLVVTSYVVQEPLVDQVNST
jgi:hypothetical protein